MEKKKFEVRVELVIQLTRQDIDDIMVAALEGGINYWCFKVDVLGEYLGEYASEQISRGGSLKLYDRENGEKYWLDLEKLLKGFELWVEGEAGGAIVVDCCEIDAGCADEIIQYALFGEVVYG